jgi:hypothetical protein
MHYMALSATNDITGQADLLEEEVPTSSASWSGTLTSLLNTPLKIPPPAALVEGASLR